MLHTTKDYDLFKLREGNRWEIKPYQVKKIMEIMQRVGFLSAYPIVVNSDFLILDGQHRFLAAKELGLHIHYVIDNDFEKALSSVNNSALTWKTKDFVAYFADWKHNENYKLLKEVIITTKMTPQIILTLLNGKVQKNYDIIKNGNLNFTQCDATKVIKYWNDIKMVNDNLRLDMGQRFVVAIDYLKRNNKNFDMKHLINQSKKYSSFAYKCQTMNQYKQMLQTIYNYFIKDKTKLIHNI